jgi:polyphenol oxidase
MVMDGKGDIVTSRIFSTIPGLVHGFSTRAWGDMRISQNRDTFIDSLGLKHHDLYWKSQMHGDIVHRIDENTDISGLSDADGAIFHTIGPAHRNIVLTVRSADCVPILFVDPKTKIIGIVHAGWQGTLLGITTKVVDEMERSSARPKDIMVFIGSHIGGCCYSVDEDRAEKFSNRFPSDDSVIIKRNGKYFADLGCANTIFLRKSGILPEHIDFDGVCTSCGIQDRYSYRKDTPATYGVMMGVIAWK